MLTAVEECLQLEYLRLQQLVARQNAQEDGGPASLGKSAKDSAEGSQDTTSSRIGAFFNLVKSNAGRHLIPDHQRGSAAPGIRGNSFAFPRMMRVGI